MAFAQKVNCAEDENATSTQFSASITTRVAASEEDRKMAMAMIIDNTQRKPSTKKRRSSPPVCKPNPVDIYVGARVRFRRIFLGLSQEKLGHAIGLTFQQVQKYERGANRISAGRLFDLSRVLGVPVSFFFENIAEEVVEDRAQSIVGIAYGGNEITVLTSKESQDLLRAYHKIDSPSLRKKIFELTKEMSEITG